MEKSYSKPYTRAYAEKYNNLYLLDEAHYQHTQYEIQLIEKLLSKKESWLDVACGTGYHLNNAADSVRKAGIDRSVDMIEYARNNSNKDIEYFVGDIKESTITDSFDLVTFLWIGYVHSNSVEDAVDTLDAASSKVSEGGSFLMTFCDPMYILESHDERGNFLGRGDMTLDGVVWSYRDDINKLEYKNLIAPNRFKITERILPDYNHVVELVYPQKNSMYWKKSALLFTKKRK